MAFTRRYGDFQPFFAVNQREDNRYTGVQAGFLTYSREDENADEDYQVSYVEVGGRSDHIADPLCSAFDREPSTLSTSSALSEDVGLLRKAA